MLVTQCLATVMRMSMNMSYGINGNGWKSQLSSVRTSIWTGTLVEYFDLAHDYPNPINSPSVVFSFSTWGSSISRQSRSKTLNANWDLHIWKCPSNVMLEVTLNSLLTTTINNAIWQHIAAPNTTQSQMYTNIHLTIHSNRFLSSESPLFLLLWCSIVADMSTSPPKHKLCPIILFSHTLQPTSKHCAKTPLGTRRNRPAIH